VLRLLRGEAQYSCLESHIEEFWAYFG